jgi:hypothetical protein
MPVRQSEGHVPRVDQHIAQHLAGDNSPGDSETLLATPRLQTSSYQLQKEGIELIYSEDVEPELYMQSSLRLLLFFLESKSCAGITAVACDARHSEREVAGGDDNWLVFTRQREQGRGC